jgi:membrane associated rhomboid family serine protease
VKVDDPMMFLPFSDINPTRRWPVVTITLIVINVAVFLYQLSLGGRGFDLVTAAYGAIPAELLTGRDLAPRIPYPVYITLLTSIFMHASFLHLAGNMLYLWIFGDNVEDALGAGRFLLFYLICGLIASLAHIIFNIGSTIPAIGASGAISGVLGAYLLLYPQGRVRVFVWVIIIIRIIQVPAWIILTGYLVLQAMAVLSGGQGGVAVWAHIGGFVAGMLLVRLFQPPKRALAPWYEQGN